YWSIGLTPLGWARFIGARASDHAERWDWINSGTVFAPFEPILAIMQTDDPDGVVAGVNDYLIGLLARTSPSADEDRIRRAHATLVDPKVGTVGEFAAKAGLTVRTLERLSAQAFGFTPKLLLRRQRFLRSLSHFMLDPSLAWLETLDTHYVDQAHFIRDFKRFMDITPRKYAALPHPVLWAAAKARAEETGTAMQVLQAPAQPEP
ncbi:MAG: AraC family transcriptional regulator, partial [Sphingomonadales bacterium]